MRALVASLLLACSAAQAGTYSITVTDSSFALHDLDPSDGITPVITPYFGYTVADLNKPLTCSGEFWADYTDMKPCASRGLYGSLSPHSAIDWSGTVTVDVRLFASPDDYENVALLGGGHGATSAATHSEFEIGSYVRSGNSHESFVGSIYLINDTDAPTDFEINIGFEAFGQESDIPRPIPEPSTCLLMLGGLALLPLARRKTKAGSR